MTENKQETTKESPKQGNAFLIYLRLGSERSLVRVRQELGKKGIKISETSLAKWSKKYEWVKRVQAMDEESQRIAEEAMVKKATIKKAEMFLYFQNVLKAANAGLLSGKVVPTPGDFKKVWEMMRIEQGKSIGQETMPTVAPAINIFLTKNEKVIKVVREAQENLRNVLEGEIKEEK